RPSISAKRVRAMLGHNGDEVRQVERLAQHLDAKSPRARPGDDDDGNSRELRVAPHHIEELEPRHSRHREIGEHDAGTRSRAKIAKGVVEARELANEVTFVA